MARVTATFNMAHGSVWDKDYIQARNDLKTIRAALAAPADIAKLANPTDAAEVTNAVTCTTILADYENRSLGIQNHILDESYLYDLTHGQLEGDWIALKPLIDAYVGPTRKGDTTYYQFEKLAAAWRSGRSLRTGRRLSVSKGRPR